MKSNPNPIPMSKVFQTSFILFGSVILVFWVVIAGVCDQFQFSVPFLIGSLAIIFCSACAMALGLLGCQLPTIKAVPYIMGGLMLEMFVPLILLIYLKFSPSLLEKSGDLVIILRYFLVFFPVCLFLEKGLVLREFNHKQSTEVK